MILPRYYGEEEVRIFIRRMISASKDTKEEIKNYIIEQKYELDEKDFLKLLEYTDEDACFKYYRNLDTAAREHFIIILNKFDDEMLKETLGKILDKTSISILTNALECQINFLYTQKETLENYPRIVFELEKEIVNAEFMHCIISNVKERG